MAVEVYPRLQVGSESDCRSSSGGHAVVHACKSPCHQRFVGYRKSLPKDDPHYLVWRQGFDLVLNLIDPPVPLFQAESFRVFLEFASEAWDSGKTLLIHCNQGESRAPSLALLFMAKRLKELPSETYQAAAAQFRSLYPRYSPGEGIRQYLSQHWESIA